MSSADQPPSFDLGSMTSPEVRARSFRTLLVPLGATEQHGPHLPVNTDTQIAVAWSTRLAEELQDATVAPVLPYGSSGEHQSFAGTLSIGQGALIMVLVELARSARNDFDQVIFVSGHAGNAEPLRAAVQQLTEEGHDVKGLLPQLPGADAHAGHTETSLMLLLAPELVRTELFEPGCTQPLSTIIEELREGSLRIVSGNGILGDPTKATATHGADVLDALIEGSRTEAGMLGSSDRD